MDLKQLYLQFWDCLIPSIEVAGACINICVYIFREREREMWVEVCAMRDIILFFIFSVSELLFFLKLLIDENLTISLLYYYSNYSVAGSSARPRTFKKVLDLLILSQVCGTYSKSFNLSPSIK